MTKTNKVTKWHCVRCNNNGKKRKPYFKCQHLSNIKRSKHARKLHAHMLLYYERVPFVEDPELERMFWMKCGGEGCMFCQDGYTSDDNSVHDDVTVKVSEQFKQLDQANLYNGSQFPSMMSQTPASTASQGGQPRSPVDQTALNHVATMQEPVHGDGQPALNHAATMQQSVRADGQRHPLATVQPKPYLLQGALSSLNHQQVQNQLRTSQATNQRHQSMAQYLPTTMLYQAQSAQQMYYAAGFSTKQLQQVRADEQMLRNSQAVMQATQSQIEQAKTLILANNSSIDLMQKTMMNLMTPMIESAKSGQVWSDQMTSAIMKTHDNISQNEQEWQQTVQRMTRDETTRRVTEGKVQRIPSALHDCDCAETKFLSLQSTIKGSIVDTLPENYNSTKNHLLMTCTDLDYELNRNQTSAVLSAYYSHMSQPRLIYKVPAGHGKSRIMAGIIACTAKSKGRALKVLVCYHHAALLDRDQDMLTDMHLNNVEIETRVPKANETVYVRANSIVLVDEIDYILLDLNVRFQSTTRSAAQITPSAVIGLTAMQAALQSENQRITSEQGFKVVDCEIKSCEIPELNVTTMEEYFQDNTYAKLVYLNTDQMPQAKRLAAKFDLFENNTSTEILRNLTANCVMLVTDELLMRGFDYRSEQGIHLLVAAQFSSIRHKDQALTRVGRFGDPCKRSRITEVGEGMLQSHWQSKMISQVRATGAQHKPQPTVFSALKASVPKCNADRQQADKLHLSNKSEHSVMSETASQWARIGLKQAKSIRRGTKTPKTGQVTGAQKRGILGTREDKQEGKKTVAMTKAIDKTKVEETKDSKM